MLPETIVLDVSSLLTTAALFVSLLSAVYAGRSAVSARRQATASELSAREAQLQNRIATNADRLAIYRGLIAFRSHIVMKMIDVEDEALWKFWEHVEVAEFYYSKDVSQKLSSISSGAFQLLRSRTPVGPAPRTEPDTQDKKALIEELCKLVGSIDLVTTDLRDELRLVGG